MDITIRLINHPLLSFVKNIFFLFISSNIDIIYTCIYIYNTSYWQSFYYVKRKLQMNGGALGAYIHSNWSFGNVVKKMSEC